MYQGRVSRSETASLEMESAGTEEEGSEEADSMIGSGASFVMPFSVSSIEPVGAASTLRESSIALTWPR